MPTFLFNSDGNIPVFSQILMTICLAVSGIPDNIVASLKEAGRLDYQVLG
jgi:hypothetical protein